MQSGGERGRKGFLYRCLHPRAGSPEREDEPAEAAHEEKRDEEETLNVAYQQRRLDGKHLDAAI